jgi:hypothetical protein
VYRDDDELLLFAALCEYEWECDQDEDNQGGSLGFPGNSYITEDAAFAYILEDASDVYVKEG